MSWKTYRNNILPTVGLVLVGALSLWLVAEYTPWLDGLPFSPWWLMVPLVAIGVAILILTLLVKAEWDTLELDTSALAAVGLVALVAANIALTLWLRPWLEGLPFSPWWLTLLAIPVWGAALGTLHLLNEGEELLDTFLQEVVVSVLLLALASANIALALWLSPWLQGLPFSPWWLLVPTSIVSLTLFLLSGWGEVSGLILPLLILLHLGSLATITSPLWGPLYGVFVFFRRHLVPESPAAPEPAGPRTRGSWSDVEIWEPRADRFYFRDYARVLIDPIRTVETPLTIGIFGRWGSGKTSLMRLMDQMLFWESLRQMAALRTLWINVWRLSTREELWNAFLQALLTRVHASLPWQQRLAFDWRLFRERVRWRKLARALVVYSYRVIITVTPILLAALWQGQGDAEGSQILAMALDPVTGGAASLVLGLWLLVKPAVEAIRETVSLDLDEVLERTPYQVQVSALQQLQDDFRQMVNAWVGEEGRLVVFVDDLDRCLPDQIAEVLEALKLFATTEKCIYVIGVDHDVVRDAVRDKYEMQPTEAAEYLEKIVQVPFHLPPLEDDRMAQFVRRDYPDVMKGCPSAPQIFSLGLEPNPRKVKRALNIYRTLLELAEARWYNWDMDHKVRPELVAKMVVLQSRFRDLHRALSREPELILGLDAWARGYLTGSGGQPGAAEAGEGAQVWAWIDQLVPEADRRALAAMLEAGEEHFDALAAKDAYIYIYLTGAGEEAAMRTRPSREERGALLGGFLPVIEEVVDEILQRGEDEQAQQEITGNYVERLTGAIATSDRFSPEERWSANLALNRLEGIAPPLSFEPPMVRVPRGPFLMGYLDEDLRMLRETLDRTPYAKVLAWLENEPQLKGFAEGFAAGLPDVLGRYVEEEVPTALAEWATFPSLTGEPFPFVADLPQGEDVRRQRRGREKKQKGWMELDLGPFFIGSFPVTNAEYLSFVEDEDYERPEYWTDGVVPEWLNTHPVVQVSWQDARAYCAWLSKKTGLIYRLPTEAEWEKAARGVSGQLFPWGNEMPFVPFYCNSFELGLLMTRDAGASSGVSPYLAADMVGNVWEWTASLAVPYPYNPDGSREAKEEAGPRVLRGGSCVDVLGAVRCSSRYGASPGTRLRNVGFRVVMMPAEWLEQAPEGA